MSSLGLLFFLLFVFLANFFPLFGETYSWPRLLFSEHSVINSIYVTFLVLTVIRFLVGFGIQLTEPSICTHAPRSLHLSLVSQFDEFAFHNKVKS